MQANPLAVDLERVAVDDGRLPFYWMVIERCGGNGRQQQRKCKTDMHGGHPAQGFG